jgi:adenylate cyclase
MSGDAEQEYFSDGISEDIITDLSKVSALSVVARNTAFTFKGKSVEAPQIARQLNVSHVLEGSVRKAGARVRITAQLIDGPAGDHLWAERWDRDLTDIFALQDEISEAIVKALKLKLLPEEKQAIERRGTENVEAYNLYLMARQTFTEGNVGDSRREETVLRLCKRAVDIDPGYARAWSLIAVAQQSLSFERGKPGDDGLAAAERALSIDATLAEPHAVKAQILAGRGLRDQALAEMQTALQLDPESDIVNAKAGLLYFERNAYEPAIRCFEKATALSGSNFGAPALLVSCYTAIGDKEGATRAAKLSQARAEQAIARDWSIPKML